MNVKGLAAHLDIELSVRKEISEMSDDTNGESLLNQGAIFVINNVFCTKAQKSTIGGGDVEFGKIHLLDEVDIVRNGSVTNHTMIAGIELAKKPVGSK